MKRFLWRWSTVWLVSMCAVACDIQPESDGDIDSDRLVDPDSDGDGDPDATDCAPNDNRVYAGADDVCDGVDNDCDAETDEDFVAELTSCGLGPCASEGATSCVSGTEIDSCVAGAASDEMCDGIDNNCDGVIPVSELDEDSDGFRGCEGDCDDTQATVYPGATEVCDGFDNNCDSVLPTDEYDADSDGVLLCQLDCDDDDPDRFPGNPEVCDGLDNDCDMEVNEWLGTGCPTCVRLVDADSSAEAPDGLTWSSAYQSLQDAIIAADLAIAGGEPSCEVWVAAGTYVPGTIPEDTFTLYDKVRLYGGFLAGIQDRSQRDWDLNATILSGDLGAGEHSLRIVSCLNDGKCGDNTVLDGFVIQHGDSRSAMGMAAGLRIEYVAPTIRNCTFRNNAAAYSGALDCINCDMTIDRCIFESNIASFDGGAVVVAGSSSAVISNSLFIDNVAGEMGGAVRIEMSVDTVQLINITATGNTSGTGGGAVDNSAPGLEIINSILWGNGAASYLDRTAGQAASVLNSNIEDAVWSGTGNISTAPEFAGAMVGDFSLSAGSPCIDTGNNTAVTTNYDLAGDTRIVGSTVDMGAYEYIP